MLPELESTPISRETLGERFSLSMLLMVKLQCWSNVVRLIDVDFNACVIFSCFYVASTINIFVHIFGHIDIY